MDSKPLKYRCPHKCGDRRFPQPTWKTEAGYARHLAACPKRPEAVAHQEDLKRQRKEREEAERVAALGSAKHKVGDEIHFVNIYVRKPIHETRRGRLVRVRYEEERVYSARTETIDVVGFDGAVVYNGRIYESEICSSFDEAQRQATERQQGYDAACRQAELCR